MGLTPTANAQNVEGALSVVAPYGADIDTRVGGTVSYTRFHAPQELRVVSEFVEAQMDVDFLGTKMMVALWDNVAQYKGRAVSCQHALVDWFYALRSHLCLISQIWHWASLEGTPVFLT